uniref:Uncharacterized protein n=1 Tax=Physcomitrium patens TaxID=3218 RepID=A0A2K1IMB3_PHYPA|nr:hypothetical protein PHYPA_026730 [Physcomitrium patens]
MLELQDEASAADVQSLQATESNVKLDEEKGNRIESCAQSEGMVVMQKCQTK